MPLPSVLRRLSSTRSISNPTYKKQQHSRESSAEPEDTASVSASASSSLTNISEYVAAAEKKQLPPRQRRTSSWLGIIKRHHRDKDIDGRDGNEDIGAPAATTADQDEMANHIVEKAPRKMSTAGTSSSGASYDASHHSVSEVYKESPLHQHAEAAVSPTPEDTYQRTASPVQDPDMSSVNGDIAGLRVSKAPIGNGIEGDSDDDDSSDEFFDPPSAIPSPVVSTSHLHSTYLPQTSSFDPPVTHSQINRDSMQEGTASETKGIEEKRPEWAYPVEGEPQLQADIREIHFAVRLFLNSRMMKAEEIIEPHHETRLYYSMGYSLLNTMRAMMTFEPVDMAAAIDLCRKTLALAEKEKSTLPRTWSEKISGHAAGAVKGSGLTLHQVERMTTLQRHAELAKAVVGLMYAGDFMAFIRDYSSPLDRRALNMRTAHAVYRTLSRFTMQLDAAHPTHRDPSLDEDFRSGVALGNGCISLILSLLPSAAGKVMELFGFGGDRELALRTLMDVGGWKKGQREPEHKEGPGNEGLRRCVCDLMLLAYHLIISSIIPVPDVDIEMADNILHYNLQCYPNGVFWLYFSGRLYSTQTLGQRAVEQYRKAIESQKEYRQIQHMINWDLGLTYMSLGDYKDAHTCFTILATESNWSKAVYAYARGIQLYEISLLPTTSTSDRKKNLQQILESLEAIPSQLKKIAGKSIPFEKWVARKSRRYLAQGGLSLPGLELAYVFQALGLSPRWALWERHLKYVDSTIQALEQKSNEERENTWCDDFCLAHLLRGVILVMIARPEAHVKLNPVELPMPLEEADKQALDSFTIILDNSLNISLEHQLAWYAHFEKGRLLTSIGGTDNLEAAKEHFSKILNDKVELGPSKGKGKVSLQSGIVLKTNAAMEQLKKKTF